MKKKEKSRIHLARPRRKPHERVWFIYIPENAFKRAQYFEINSGKKISQRIAYELLYRENAKKKEEKRKKRVEKKNRKYY